jgi:hypothetical protein
MPMKKTHRATIELKNLFSQLKDERVALQASGRGLGKTCGAEFHSRDS